MSDPMDHLVPTREGDRRRMADRLFLEDAAANSLFAGLAAGGWHTAALTMRLLVTGGVPIAGGIVGVGGEIVWPRPTRPGDELQVVSEVTEIRPSRTKPAKESS